MKIAWRLKGHNLTEQELILGNCLSESWAEPLLIRHLADEVHDGEFADTKAGRALTRKLNEAPFAEVERLGF